MSLDDKALPESPIPPSVDANSSNDIKKNTNYGNVPDDRTVTPGNLSRTITNASISSEPTGKDPEITNAPGYRAAEAYVRPTALVVAGKVIEGGFDLRNAEYQLKLDAPVAATEDAPTVIFLPEFHFPKEDIDILVSSGKWELSIEEDEEAPDAPPLQRLRWWHSNGEQLIKIKGKVRPRKTLEGTPEEAGYLDQCRSQYGACSLM